MEVSTACLLAQCLRRGGVWTVRARRALIRAGDAGDEYAIDAPWLGAALIGGADDIGLSAGGEPGDHGGRAGA